METALKTLIIITTLRLGENLQYGIHQNGVSVIHHRQMRMPKQQTLCQNVSKNVKMLAEQNAQQLLWIVPSSIRLQSHCTWNL